MGTTRPDTNVVQDCERWGMQWGRPRDTDVKGQAGSKVNSRDTF